MDDSIYDRIREHQVSEGVPWRELRAELVRMAGVFVVEFNLNIEEYVIGIGRLPVTRLGQYRIGSNDLGLKAEILISENHIRNCIDAGEEWRIYGTLLHELDHAWQEVHGKASRPPYHNREFRNRALDQGLIIDSRGYTQYDPDSPFFAVLEREKISFPPIPEPKRFRKKEGKSTLSKWSCDCHPPQAARIGKKDFLAICPLCNTMFSKVS